jgi:transcriptional regulator GlxA family with amidase domain
MSEDTMTAPKPFEIGIPVYPGVDLPDVAAPREVFGWLAETVAALPDPPAAYRVRVLGESRRPVVTRAGLPIVPEATFAAARRLDLLWVPGGSLEALQEYMACEPFLDRLRGWAERAAYVTSVCEGAMLLAAAGLLDGYSATTHWAFLGCLAAYPQITVLGEAEGYPRSVLDPGGRPLGRGTRVTGAGISSALDESLKIVELLAGTSVAQQVTCSIQYFPDPPVPARLPPTPACPLGGGTAG